MILLERKAWESGHAKASDIVAIFDTSGVDGSLIGLFVEPRPCACGRMVAMVVNREGRTRCVTCDDEYRKDRRKNVSQ